GPSTGVAIEVRGRLPFANYPDLAGQEPALAVKGKTDRRGWPPRQLLDAALKFRLRAGAVYDCRRLAPYDLVVRRHSPAGERRGSGKRRAATRHSRAEYGRGHARRARAGRKLLLLVLGHHRCLRAAAGPLLLEVQRRTALDCETPDLV